MPSVNEIYPSNTAVKASDLKGHAVKVKIASTEIKKFDDGSKVVLHFEGKDKVFVCNKTNAMIIAATYGQNPESWLGKSVELYPDKTMFGTNLVDCIRVRIPVPPAGSPTADDIPFS